MDEKAKQRLWKSAFDAAKNSYSPYSHFSVGAAILFSDGKVVTGCNIENRSYGLTNCAERTAIFNAISQGESGKIVAIAVAAPNSDNPLPPCGACRQVLSEFAGGDALVIFGLDVDALISVTLSQLYPYDSLHELSS